MAKIYAPKSPEVSARETQNMERSRRIAADGMVLLENNGVLPLKAGGRALAVFGSGTGLKYGPSSPVLCIKAGNDLIMPGSQEDLDAVVNAVGADLTLAELQACAKRVLALAALRVQSTKA